jgi:hypothetical protein
MLFDALRVQSMVSSCDQEFASRETRPLDALQKQLSASAGKADRQLQLVWISRVAFWHGAQAMGMLSIEIVDANLVGAARLK